MFTVTFKLTKKQIAAAAAALVVAFAGGLWIRSAMTDSDADAESTGGKSGGSSIESKYSKNNNSVAGAASSKEEKSSQKKEKVEGTASSKSEVSKEKATKENATEEKEKSKVSPEATTSKSSSIASNENQNKAGTKAESEAEEKSTKRKSIFSLDSKPKVEKTEAKTNEQRVAFLETFGWQVDDQEEEIIEVLIPKTMDEVLTTYNSIQKAQGCDLTQYSGKRCKRYSYTILNYPEETAVVRANILVYNGKVIGGDVCSLELDGFMHGFAPETD